jgi:hypothetical protein
MAYVATLLAPDAGKQLNVVIRRAADTCTTFRASSLVASQSGQEVMGLMAKMSSSVQLCNSLIVSPGLDQFFKDSYDDQSYDVQAEYTPMISAMQAIGVNIKNALPLSTNGFVERETVEPDGSITDRMFATGSTVLITARADIDAFLVTVEV